jgi:ribosomal protein S2/predicted RNA-binding protein with TRAM domain
MQKQKTKKVKVLKPGVRLTVKITALGPNNMAINEFSYGMPILVPNAQLGHTVQVQIVKIYKQSSSVAIAKLIKKVATTDSSLRLSKAKKQVKTTPVLPMLKPGDVLNVNINKLGPNKTAMAELNNTYHNVNKVIVPSANEGLMNQNLTVTVTRVKSNYAFAIANNAEQSANYVEAETSTKFKGTKFTLVLPSTRSARTQPKQSFGSMLQRKTGLKFMVFKLQQREALLDPNSLNFFKTTLAERASMAQSLGLSDTVMPSNTILFLKPRLGAKSGDKVQIQITKFIPGTDSLKPNVAVAKIVKLNPMSAKQKKALIFANLRQMLKSGMHYGEKAIKCNARMKNYVWMNTASNPLGTARTGLAKSARKPLIKKGRNIINLLKTRRCLNKALAQLGKYAAKGKTFLFVGTKKAASGLVSRASLFSKKAFFVNTRWLGGMLTNWKTIVKSISKIKPILKEKQIIIKDILQKRQNIKARLIQKAVLLRKKSKLMLKKGRQLIAHIKTLVGHKINGGTNSIYSPEKTNILNAKRKELISKGIAALEKRQQLLVKRQEIILQSQTLKSKASQLTNAYSQLLTNLVVARKKLRELKSLLLISKELQGFKQQAQQQNQNVYMVAYNKFRTLKPNNFILLNPPKEILNKIVSLIKADPNQSPVSDLKSTKTIYISQLLSKFSLFVPSIKNSIKNLQNYTVNIQTGIHKILNLFTVVKNKMATYVDLKTKIVAELRQIKQTLQTERNIIRVLKRKLKQISAQKRLIKFLPKLRYLPTPTQKVEQTARFLMKKFVDPKMKYSMDAIYDEKLTGQSKKLAASRKQKWQRLEKYLGGISNMTKLKDQNPNNFMRNNVAIIIGQLDEMNAVRECQKLGIKMFHIVDTNCNPGYADHFIPANDDARNSIKYILAKFLTRIRLAHKLKNKFRRFSKKVKTNKYK